jgi:hypothetical protein
MMRTNANLVRRLTAIVVLLVAMAPENVSTQASASDAGLKAFIGIRTTPTRQGEVRSGTFVGDDMLPGESSRFNIAVGNANSLCYSSVWTSPSTPPTAIQAFAEREEASAHYVYRFDVRTLEVLTDRITFDLTWQRRSRTTPGEVLQRTQQLTLREGESRPVDLLHDKEGTDCLSVVLQVTAEIVADAAPRANALEWDLWLGGTTQTDTAHRTLTSVPGEGVRFQFEPVATTATEASGKVNAVLVHVYGQVRGRVRPDGSIDVALNTNRTVSLSLSDAPRPTIPKDLSFAGGSGQKNFVLKPGEAVKIILPPLGGRVEFRTDPVTGRRTGRAVPLPAGAPPANEMSITVQARVR